ncbi:16S rRNA (cytosine(1402)-N(4))-methyltransferase, partial [Candidatus Similichlamydia epinepheli]|uniref:16S rRNA (cytosine(1402)-N(4))-methyltransferase n=1 Tax=Candidatus Similichlamydia epinepheli TaxID=1903953 RepID=UPI000D3D0520
MQYSHVPVLLNLLHPFLPTYPFSYLDCTVGCGGHAQQILRNFQIRLFVGVDRDPLVLKKAEETLKPDLPEFSSFVHSDFASFAETAVKDAKTFDF